MSKPVKQLITRQYGQRFEGVTGAVLIDVRGIDANSNNTLRAGLAAKQIKITVVKNSLARKAFDDTDMAAINDLLDGPSAMVYSIDGDVSVVNVARELITWAKQLDKMQFKGAIMDGQLFGPDQIDALSKYPTREEALSQTVQLLLSPAQNLVSSILSPGRKVASLVDAIKEKLEKGEAIGKVA